MGTLEVVADVLPRSVGPYLALMVAGFVVAIWGHGMKSKWTVTIGIAMIFSATLLLPIALQLLSEGDSSAPDSSPASRSRDFETPAPFDP